MGSGAGEVRKEWREISVSARLVPAVSLNHIRIE
jgi:hypothetical protein